MLFPQKPAKNVACVWGGVHGGCVQPGDCLCSKYNLLLPSSPPTFSVSALLRFPLLSPLASGWARKSVWGGGCTVTVLVSINVSQRKVDVRLPGKGNSKSHVARLVHLIITMIK